MKKRTTTTGRIYRAGLGLLATLPIALFGCNNAPAGGGNDGSTADALSYQGTISGKAIDSQSTRGDTSETASGQTVPPEFDTSNAVARFEDLNGQPLLDENGEPFPAVPLNADGSFDAENLPVGTDFILCIDIENDGVCDIQSCINIPADGPDDPSGTLNGAEADPLTTIVLAKLRELMDQRGIRPEDLPFSPAAVVSRIVAAYTNLYDESGVDQTILLDDIQSLTPEEIAAYFDSFIPPIAQAGMQMAEGSIDTALASDVEDVAFGAAQVFLRAGFPIVDNPGGLDLTPLADLDGVEVTTMSELFKQGGGMGPGGPGGPVDGAPVDIPQDILDALPPDIVDQIPPDFNGDVSTLSPEVIDAIIAADPALADLLNGAAPLPAQEEPPVYINKQAEPNRNFTGEGEDGGPQGPIMNDHLLIEMARLQMTGATITVGELQDLLTNLDTGLGARLTYFLFHPNFFAPSLIVL